MKVFLLAYHLLDKLPDDYFTREQEKNILVAALFHDIGKGMWPQEWLTAPRRELKEKVWTSMQMHPIIGSELLQGLGFESQSVLDIIIQHHEKLNGSGYPDGIIPNKEALFLSTCDMLAAATEDRQYRKALSFNEALKELKEQIDPSVYQAIIS